MTGDSVAPPTAPTAPVTAYYMPPQINMPQQSRAADVPHPTTAAEPSGA